MPFANHNRGVKYPNGGVEDRYRAKYVIKLSIFCHFDPPAPARILSRGNNM